MKNDVSRIGCQNSSSIWPLTKQESSLYQEDVVLKNRVAPDIRKVVPDTRKVVFDATTPWTLWLASAWQSRSGARGHQVSGHYHSGAKQQYNITRWWSEQQSGEKLHLSNWLIKYLSFSVFYYKWFTEFVTTPNSSKYIFKFFPKSRPSTTK